MLFSHFLCQISHYFRQNWLFRAFIRFLYHFCCYVKDERLRNVKTHG